MNNEFFKSKIFTGSLITIGMIVVLLLVFRAGMIFGYHRAVFSIGWGQNYEKNFVGPNKMIGMMGPRGKALIVAHGSNGQIIKIDTASGTSTITVKDQDGTEKSVLVTDNTLIRKFTQNIKRIDLREDDHVSVIGSPNPNGQIEAKLIRIFPQ